MKTQHTSGPWFLSIDDPTRVLKQFTAKKIRNEVVTSTKRSWMTEREQIANAQLIAAAPELLAALCRALETTYSDSLHAEWSALIAKATRGVA